MGPRNLWGPGRLPSSAPACVDISTGGFYNAQPVKTATDGQVVAKPSHTCWKCGRRLEVGRAGEKQAICPHCGAALADVAGEGRADEMDGLIGQRLGEFDIVGRLGRGGMGAVYRARQAALDRFVAVKVLSASLSADDSYVARFGREARAAAAVSHPNIIEIYSVGEDRGYQYIAMELVDGVSLADLLEREGRLPPERALDVLRQTAAALAEAHDRGILHRDIKPANILLGPKGRVKVADFGLARRPEADAAVTLPGQALGTPLYLPPDVARGHPPGARSDLYSLGVTLYQALAGRPPFDGQTPAEVILKHAEAPIPPLQELAPHAPPALCRIIHRLLCKDPADRYPSAQAVLEALEGVEGPGGRPPSAPRAVSVTATMAVPTRPAPGDDRAARRRRWPLALAAGIGAACIALALALLLAGRPRRREAIVYTEWPFHAAEAKRRQAETAAALGVPVEQTVDIGSGVEMTFVLIPAGEFLMGSPTSVGSEEIRQSYRKIGLLGNAEFPQHRVRISKPFSLGKLEVTQEQWHAVVGGGPSGAGRTPQDPVVRVSAEDCRKFIQKLTAKLGRPCRLPTEAEWEYACRAGAPSLFHFGEGPTNLDAHAWFLANANDSLQPVGQKAPNAWGLHDMAGNVWEHCTDWFGPYAAAAATDPTGPGSGTARVRRGGCWRSGPEDCRSACRKPIGLDGRTNTVGFRVALGLE